MADHSRDRVEAAAKAAWELAANSWPWAEVSGAAARTHADQLERAAAVLAAADEADRAAGVVRVDTRAAVEHAQVKRFINDPGAVVGPQDPAETLGHWQARAVLAGLAGQANG